LSLINSKKIIDKKAIVFSNEFSYIQKKCNLLKTELKAA